MKLNRTHFFVIGLIFCESVARAQTWPINQSDDPAWWNKISATFGEIHPTNGDHFHGAIDIDVYSKGCPFRAIEAGRILAIGSTTIVLEHLYPSGTQNYNRRSRYLHVIPSSSLVVGSVVTQGSQIATVQDGSATSADHLHLEMWQTLSENWNKINPFGNQEGWQLGTPADEAGPEINDVFIEPINQNNNAGSGFFIFKNGSGSLTNRDTYAKIHFRDRSGSTGSVFNFDNDKLVVFGNIRPIVSARDASINSSASSGTGLTIHRINYRIDNSLKYQIYFDKISPSSQGYPSRELCATTNHSPPFPLCTSQRGGLRSGQKFIW